MKRWVYELDNEYVRIPGSSLPAPKLTYIVAEGVWRLDEDYPYHHGPNVITLRQGFKSDLASVPRPFWWLIGPFDLSVSAPLVHDFLYDHQGKPPPGSIVPSRTYMRKQADLLFRTMMEQEGVAPWRRALAYPAVRAFAWLDWYCG